MKHCSTCHCHALKLYTLADETTSLPWLVATMQVCQRCLLEIKAKLSQIEEEK